MAEIVGLDGYKSELFDSYFRCDCGSLPYFLSEERGFVCTECGGYLPEFKITRIVDGHEDNL